MAQSTRRRISIVLAVILAGVVSAVGFNFLYYEGFKFGPITRASVLTYYEETGKWPDSTDQLIQQQPALSGLRKQEMTIRHESTSGHRAIYEFRWRFLGFPYVLRDAVAR